MTVLFILPKSLLSPRKDLLLYYLYCLCKSVQRSLLFEECSFSKADAKVKTFKHILQMFSEVFFKNSFLIQNNSLAKGRTKKRLSLPPGFKKSISINAASFLKAGAKVRTLSHIFQIFSEVFSFFFLKGKVSKETTRLRKKKVKILTPFLSECQSNAAPVLESGCKSRAF